LLHEFFVTSVRTPGGKLVYQYLKKPKKIPRCGQCKDKLRGIQPARSMERSRMCRRKKTVKRAYGGVLCHKCVKERWVYSVSYPSETFLCGKFWMTSALLSPLFFLIDIPLCSVSYSYYAPSSQLIVILCECVVTCFSQLYGLSGHSNKIKLKITIANI